MSTKHGGEHAIGLGLSAEIKKLLREHENRPARHGVLERLGLDRADLAGIGCDHSFRIRSTFAAEWAAKAAKRIKEQHRLAQRSTERHGAGPQLAQHRNEVQSAHESSISSAGAAQHIRVQPGWLQQAKVSNELSSASPGIAQLSPQTPGFATQSTPREAAAQRQQQGENLPEFRQGEQIAASDKNSPEELLPEQPTSLDTRANETTSAEPLTAAVKAAIETQYRSLEEKLIRDFSLRRNR
jgi:hypothetical protein